MTHQPLRLSLSAALREFSCRFPHASVSAFVLFVVLFAEEGRENFFQSLENLGFAGEPADTGGAGP